MKTLLFLKDYWAISLGIISTIIATVLYRFGLIDLKTQLAIIIISFVVFSISDSIRQLLFRNQVLESFNLISEARVINGTTEFFRDLYNSISDIDTTRIDMCYFTQQPPTNFYHLNDVKSYWENVPKLLMANSGKVLRRIVMVGNNDMLEWLKSHMRDDSKLHNYHLSVIVDHNSNNSFINLCLTNNGQCFLFSPHATHEQPSYIWIKNRNIHNSLLVSYEKMWANATLVVRGGTIIESNWAEVQKELSSTNWFNH